MSFFYSKQEINHSLLIIDQSRCFPVLVNLKKNVFKHIFNHLQENKLLCKFQSDFLPGCSTTHQLVELYHRILLALDSKQFTSVTFADINKAFDTVWIKGLLLKLE
jgi:hypothetical protein